MPKGYEAIFPILGDCKFEEVCINCVKVRVGHFIFSINQNATFPLGTINSEEPMLFPSREQRDWNKWVCPKKPRFDPKTLRAFDRVLARIDGSDVYCWFADFVSTPTIEKYDILPCIMSNKGVKMIIPYNDDTKHLVGTTEEAPEHYRYWED